jgi:putative endonuclease
MGDLSHHIELGKRGESIAAEYLLGKGYRIRHRNWRFGPKELDIVATRNGMLVFVEVKTRWSSYWEEPKESVRRRKQRHIAEAAEAYIQKYELNMDAQFDIISIVLQGDRVQIEHIEDAFYPAL